MFKFVIQKCAELREADSGGKNYREEYGGDYHTSENLREASRAS